MFPIIFLIIVNSIKYPIQKISREIARLKKYIKKTSKRVQKDFKKGSNPLMDHGLPRGLGVSNCHVILQ